MQCLFHDYHQSQYILICLIQNQYNTLVDEYIQKKQLITQLVKYFDERLRSFKKSKQQMIKLIIRKTQRHYKLQHNCKKDERFKKFGGFKSMNSIYLEKLFSDPNFIRSYTVVTKNFIQQFQKQSDQKLTDFSDKICSATLQSIDEKNKMPWPACWVQKLNKVTLELKATYVGQKFIQLSALKKKPKRC